MRVDRRALLLALAAAPLAGCTGLGKTAAPAVPAWSEGTRLVLLGTMAGPVLHPARAMNSQAIFVDGHGYLVDCGYGTIGRMTELGIPLSALRQVYVTHHHSDHTADYPALINLAWIMGVRGQLQVFGPPPMRAVHEAALAVFEEDSRIRVAATRREAPARAFAVREIREPGLVFEDARIRVTAALADHAPFEVALAYRFETAARSIVISGDTAPSPKVAALARGADILVHEAMYVPGIDAMLAKRSYVPPQLRRFLAQGHTSAADAGRIAAQAGVRTLVLSHLLPGDEPVAEQTWVAEARRHFDGEIIVGRDRLVL
ncbi:MBL fold metallo-hydrolase [Xenophilus arseniciresistens]|uniref:MBL fold metallo-hydrolase n=1 Tax=Xenophilus arseniciresistens TaxID=1283306 RepID=A0AAE3N696_9BURK|nr:MBL fold metallo-hydrolase [Xenophilus arseniciresistens]MDA7415653.1 MBL fold metallo-hydrolase [Xenophilus arseniciresistens]